MNMAHMDLLIEFIRGKNYLNDKCVIGIIAGKKEKLDSFLLKVDFLGTTYWIVTSSYYFLMQS